MIGTVVDLTARKRWVSPPTVDHQAERAPPSKIASDPDYREDMDSVSILAEMKRMAWMLRARHGRSADIDASILEAVLSE